MPQPTFTPATIAALSDTQIAEELRQWAAARKKVNVTRSREGKAPLDTLLLEEAALRITRLRNELTFIKTPGGTR